MKGSVLTVLATAALVAAWPSAAAAAPWCGTTATDDRPALVGGSHVHVLYVIAPDGVDASSEWAPRISADVDSIDGWWRAQDATRAPRFDLAAFSCAPQIDLTLVRLTRGVAQFGDDRTLFAAIAGDPEVDRWLKPTTKVLVYYDGPVNDPHLCGQGATEVAAGLAVVYTSACPGVPTDAVAAHELLHALGAVAPFAPNVCMDGAHACDSTLDVMYPLASKFPLSSLALDVGRDDYYGHGGAWLDVRRSDWLLRLDAQSALGLQLRGGGTVTSDVPGIDCAASCRRQFNTGTELTLKARPAAGQRFVRWRGACSSTSIVCDVELASSQSVGALFAPASFRLATSVGGRGRVTGAGIACPSHCARDLVSFRAAVLHAVPAQGWKLKTWSGACHGSRPTCSLPMSAATSARAIFIRS